jgi:undecaprenyl-phosphate galactose phosphotransferase
VTTIIRTVGHAKLLLALTDVLILLLVALLIIGIRIEFTEYLLQANEILLFVASAVIAVPIFREVHLYRHKVFAAGADQVVNIGKGMLWLGILQAVILFFIKDLDLLAYSRVNILLFIFGGWFFLSVMRIGVMRKLFRRLINNHVITRKILAIGAGHAGQNLAAHINQSPELGLSLRGFVDDDPTKIGKKLLGKPIYGPIAQVATVAQHLLPDEIYVTINSIEYNRLLAIVEECRSTGLPVTVTTNHFRIIQNKVGTSEFESIPTFTLRPREIGPSVRFIKRSMDIVGGLFLLLILSPLLLAIALAVKLTSSGPVLYKSNVVGKHGKLFTWYKFRTMYNSTDDTVHREHLRNIISGNSSTEKLKNDRRITSVGKILRKYSLDELPQLLNVLRGEMSLIGPRPCLQYEYECFDEWHKLRFQITPGMTGLWQVLGRNKHDVTFNDSVMLDLYYIQHCSIWLDLKIILKTIPIVLFGRGGV